MFPALYRTTIAAALVFAASLAPDHVLAQTAGPGDDLRVSWEVKNRFRLFRDERDFLRHVAALQSVSVRLSGTIAPGMTCQWTFEDPKGDAQNFRGDCGAEVTLRVRYGTPTIAS